MTAHKLLIVAFVGITAGGVLGYTVGVSKEIPASAVTKDTVSMEHAMDSMNAGLEGLAGDDFDKAFLSEMIVHHRGAVEMAHAALERAGHEEIKTMADAIITAQEAEIAQMEAWQTAWYGADAMQHAH